MTLPSFAKVPAIQDDATLLVSEADSRPRAVFAARQAPILELADAAAACFPFDAPGIAAGLLAAVEGFGGSGCPVGYLVDRLYEILSASSALILSHALNPFGFAWLRRVNKDNVDLNRNFQRLDKSLHRRATSLFMIS